MGTLYCGCDRASQESCDDCKKNLLLKPDIIIHCKTWKRDTSDIKIKKEKK